MGMKKNDPYKGPGASTEFPSPDASSIQAAEKQRAKTSSKEEQSSGETGNTVETDKTGTNGDQTMMVIC